MQALSAASLLALWESGLGLDSPSRAQLLLAAALPEQQRADLANFSIGERDYYLLQVRQLLFGTQMINIAQCPNCQERVEWESKTTDLLLAGEGKYPIAKCLSIQHDSYQIVFRLPKFQELAWLFQQTPAISTPQELLLQSCVLEVRKANDEVIPFAELPLISQQAVLEAMEAADPLARIDLDLSCPACGCQWQALFDITSFLWAETQAWAERTLRSVHLLAKAYGWSELDILAMTPTRRQLYLGMVAS